MLYRRTVVKAAYDRINAFSRNIQPEHVQGRHAEEIVAAKRSIYNAFLAELRRELDDPDAAEELVCEESAADVFENLMAEISAQHEALHDISRVLMNSYVREDQPEPSEASAVPAA